MVLSFFGKKPQSDGKGGDPTTEPKHKDSTTTMDFSHIAGGDMGRALASAAGKIQVQEVAYEDVAAIEEAAILYANANEDGAKTVLEQAIDGGGSQAERVWAMLFDLYRLTGDKTNFDVRGVAYAQAYEKSPPVWQGVEHVAAAPQRDGAPAVNLTGTLSGAARTQFEQLARIGVKMGKLRIDLSRLKGIDESGCMLFNDTLSSLRQGKVKIQMFGAQQALSLVEPRLKVGEPEGRVFWQVALSLLQYLGNQDKFEDAAVNYAITFEESPPSWDPGAVERPTDTAGIDLPKIEEAPQTNPNCFVLDGVIAGAQPEIARKFAVYAAEQGNRIEIDASNLLRLEFVSAGSLFNQFATLQGQGKLCVIRHPNEMVAALMRVMGIDQVAQIDYKKF